MKSHRSNKIQNLQNLTTFGRRSKKQHSSWKKRMRKVSMSRTQLMTIWIPNLKSSVILLLQQTIQCKRKAMLEFWATILVNQRVKERRQTPNRQEIKALTNSKSRYTKQGKSCNKRIKISLEKSRLMTIRVKI